MTSTPRVTKLPNRVIPPLWWRCVRVVPRHSALACFTSLSSLSKSNFDPSFSSSFKPAFPAQQLDTGGPFLVTGKALIPL